MGKLSGRRVLILEDEFLIAHDMAAIILRAGGSVEGPFHSVRDAERAIRDGDFDLAALDVRLRGEDAFATAGSLADRGTPFVFVTGYDGRHLPPPWRHRPRCPKPIEPVTLVEALVSALQRKHDLVDLEM